MATNKNTVTKDPEKTADLPPYGSRNPDPITDSPGSHPIETGIGAAIGGIASGAAVGAVGGPVGAVIGGIIGGTVAGGLAGKGVGELIDPTTEDNWIREWYDSDETARTSGRTPDTYRDAYRYGLAARTTHSGRRFEQVEKDLRTGWEQDHQLESGIAWDEARGAARHAFDKTLELREEELRADKHTQKTGEVDVRKEVTTERKTITVPVEREEVVISRRPASGQAGGSVRAEEIRIPVSEEKVSVHKDTVVKEEVTVGKRKVQGTETVSEDVRKEELRVEEKGNAKVRKS